MKGGRSQNNIFEGFSTVKVAGALNNNNAWVTTTDHQPQKTLVMIMFLTILKQVVLICMLIEQLNTY